MGLLDVLGLTALSQAPGRPLKDADFAADAKRRKLADEEARRRGQEIANAKPDKPGKGPQPGLIDKQIDKKAEKLLSDAEKKARQLNKDTMPEFELFEELTPEAEFAKDLEAGIRNAEQQVKFIRETIAYAEKYGDQGALKPIGAAAASLNKISGGVLKGLGQAGKAATLGKDVIVFFQAMQGFADASRAMSADDGKSVQAWVGSLKRLWNAGKPFVDRLKDEAFTAALAGSEAAAALSATLAVVGAQLFIGIKALEAGVTVVNAYFENLHRRTAEPREGIEERPAPPQAPLPFRTRAETIASIKQHEVEKKQLDKLREQNRKEAQRQQTVQQATEAFETTEFPTLYRKQWRKPIMGKVAEAWRKTRGTSDDVREWWGCFIDDRPVSDEDPPEPNDAEIPEPPPRKASATAEDAADEVRRFLDVSPPCPYFKAIYEGELKKYLGRLPRAG